MSAPLRFVVLQHTGTASYKPGVHWDLLCECEQELRAWECPADPFSTPTQQVRELPLHRKHYLDYEGTIDGDRGTVARSAAGTFTVLVETESRFEIDLTSPAFQGILCLAREANQTLLWQLHLK